jgi:hypothetical protein
VKSKSHYRSSPSPSLFCSVIISLPSHLSVLLSFPHFSILPLSVRCKKLSQAKKQLYLYKPPNILSIQFKRFSMFGFGGKISKPIEFDEKLNIAPYCSQQLDKSFTGYSLYAVLVHSGPTANSGHYFCFVRNSSGAWYLMDDSTVRQVSLATVLKQQAFILFYTRDPPASISTPSPAPSITSSLSSLDFCFFVFFFSFPLSYSSSQ